MANRFHKVESSPFVSTFTALPLEFMQKQLDKKQQGYDTALATDDALNTEFAGVQAGMYGNTLFKTFQDKYQPRIQELTKKLSDNPEQYSQISREIRTLKNEMSNDPIKQAIKDTKTYTDALAQKTIGMKDPYVYDPTHSDFQVGEAIDPSRYNIVTDSGISKEIFDEVSKIPSDSESIYGSEGYPTWGVDAEGNLIKTGTILKDTDKETRAVSKILNYLESKKAEVFASDKMKYQLILEAERLQSQGDKRSAKEIMNDINVKEKVFKDISQAAVQLAFEQTKTKFETQKNKIEIDNSNINKKDGTPSANNNPSFTTEQVATTIVGGFTDNEGEIINNPTQFDKTSKFYTDKANQSKQNFIKAFGGFDDKTYNFDYIANNTNIDSDGKVTFTEGFEDGMYSNMANAIREDEVLKTNISNYKKSLESQKNIDGFHEQLKEATGVENYDPKIIDEARKKSYNEAYTNKSLNKGVGSGGGLTESELAEINLETDKNVYKHLDPKSNEYKIHQALENFNKKQANTILYALNPEKFKEELRGIAIGVKANNIELYDATSNQKVDMDKRDLVSELFDDEGKARTGVQFGYFIDASQGTRGYIRYDGKIYEYDINQFDVSQNVKISDDDKELLKIRSQASKSLASSYGQKGSFMLGDQQVDFKLVIDENGDRLYEYRDENQKVQRVSSMDRVITDNVNKQKKQSIGKLAVNQARADLMNMLNSGSITQEEFDEGIRQLEKSQSRWGTSLGKQNPQSQVGPLGN